MVLRGCRLTRHGGTDGEVEVRAMACDGDVGGIAIYGVCWKVWVSEQLWCVRRVRHTIDVDRIIASLEE